MNELFVIGRLIDDIEQHQLPSRYYLDEIFSINSDIKDNDGFFLQWLRDDFEN